MYLITIGLILAVIALFYIFLIWNFNFWRKRGVNGPKPLPLLGNYPSAFTQKRSVVYDVDEIYRKFKKTDDYIGLFSSRSPQLLVLSPELARRVFIADFKHFHDNEASLMVDEKSDFIFANNPFILTGEKWKQRRAEVTPGLTVSRIKAVYPVTNKVCEKMTTYLKEHIRVPPKDGVDMKDFCLRFTSEVVTDSVLGLNADSFSEKPSPILGMIKNLFEQSYLMIIYFVVVSFLPAIKRFMKVRFVPKPTEKFFVDLMQSAIDARRGQMLKAQQGIERIDFLNYMLQLQDKKHLSTMQLTAHTMTFLIDGYETTAGVLAHTLLMLTRHPAALARVRNEYEPLLEKNGFVDFDKLNELPYLDACIHETIRIFPPGFISVKICTEPIELVNKNGHTLRVDKNQTVVIPNYSIMMDEYFYPNPQEFQPERFLEENGGLRKYRDMGVYYGFGDGPRICIGMRFALAQIKAAIVEITHNFNIKINPKTRSDNILDPTYFIARLNGGIWLDFEERK